MQVADISVLSEKNKVVGCSFNQSFVGLWVVDLKDVRPFGLGRNSAADNPVHSAAAAAAAVARSEPSLPGSMSGRGEIPRGSSGGGVSASMAPLPPRRSAAVGSTVISPQRRVSNGEEPAAGRGSGGGGGGGGAEGRPYGRAMERGTSSGLEPSSRQQPVMAAPSGVLTRLNSVGSAAAAGRYVAAGAGDSFDAPPEAMQRPASFPNSSQRPGAAAAAAYAASAKPGGVGMVSVGVGVGDSLARGQVDPGQLYALAEQGAAAVGQRLEPSGGGVRPNRSSAGPREDVGLSRGDQLQQQQPPGRRSDADVVADILGRHDQVGRRFLLPSPPFPHVTPLDPEPCPYDPSMLLTHLTHLTLHFRP